MSWPLPDYEAELGQVTSQSVDQLGLVPHQQVSLENEVGA